MGRWIWVPLYRRENSHYRQSMNRLITWKMNCGSQRLTLVVRECQNLISPIGREGAREKKKRSDARNGVYVEESRASSCVLLFRVFERLFEPSPKFLFPAIHLPSCTLLAHIFPSSCATWISSSKWMLFKRGTQESRFVYP